jgi:hypothetical protein
MLVEKDEKLEHSRAGVAWEKKGMTGRKSRGHAVYKKIEGLESSSSSTEGITGLRGQHPYLFVDC